MQSFLARLSTHPMRAVALLCLALFLSGNWILPLLDRDEPRFPEASREMLQRHDSEVRMARGVALMSLLALVLTLPGFAWARTRLVTANLWQQVRPHAQAEMEVAFIEFGEPSLVWEFRELITNHLEPITIAQATAFLNRSSPRILVLPTAELSGPLRELATNAVLVRATGLDTVQFKHWDLTAVVKP